MAEIYTIGGTVQAGGGRYLPRKADEELLGLCSAGTFAYILTPRQMGKSSLMVRTAESLSEKGIRPVIIDLSQIGVEVTEDKWYLGILAAIEESLELETDIFEWWKANEKNTPSQRLTVFFEKVMLAEVEEPVVIFFDEIDTTLSLPFTDDFFAAIRSVHNARALVEDFKRLSFVLIGVAAPYDLISDPKRTPFNIGRQVDLPDFTYEEASPFADGFGLAPDKNRKVLSWVLKWTKGHPYLTQRLCHEVVSQSRADWSEEGIDGVVDELFFSEAGAKDSNLLFVRDMLSKRASNPVEVLKVYREVRLGMHPVRDDEQSLIISHLKLSGVVTRVNNNLKLRNPIYQEVFGKSWINEHLKFYIDWPSVLRRVAIVVFIVSISLAIWALNERGKAMREAVRANSANSALNESISQLNLANQSLTNAFSALESTNQVLSDTYKDLASKNLVLTNTLASLASTNLALVRTYAALASTNQALSVTLRDLELATNNLALANKTTVSNLFESFVTRASLLARNEEYAAARDSLNSSRIHDREMSSDRLHARDLLTWFVNLMGVQEESRHMLTDVLRDVAVSSDGTFIAAVGENGTVALLDLSREEIVSEEIGGLANSVSCVVFHPKVKWIAAAGEERHIIRVSLPEKKQLSTLRAPGRVTALAISPDGSRMASGGDDNNVTLWDAESGGILSTLRGHSGAIAALAFSPDGELLASASFDGTARVWNLEGRNFLRSSDKSARALEGHTDKVLGLAFHPEGHMLATGSADRSVRLWDLSTGNSSSDSETPFRSFQGHENDVTAVLFTRNPVRLVTGSMDRTLRVWDIDSGVTAKILQGHQGGVTGVTARGGNVYSVSNDQTVRSWNLSGDGSRRFVKTVEYSNAIPESTAITADGSLVAVGFQDGGLNVYSLPELSLVWNQTNAHRRNISRLAFGPKNEALVSAGFGKEIKVWNSRSGKLNHTIQSHTEGINAIAFARNGKFFASAGSTKSSGTQDNASTQNAYVGEIGLFELGSDNEIKSLFLHQSSEALSVSFDFQSRTLVSSANDGGTRLWDVTKRPPSTKPVSFASDSDQTTWASFSPSGERIAVAGRSGILRIMDAADGTLLQELPGHQNTIIRAEFSPDGQHVVTISTDATLRFWDLRKETELFSLRLPATGGFPVPLWDFDFLGQSASNRETLISVPLTNGKLVVYNLGKIY